MYVSAIETVGTLQMQMEYSLRHVYILFPRPLLPIRNTCFAPLVSGLDFTWAVLMHFPSPVPTSQQ